MVEKLRVQEFAASTPSRVDTEKGVIYGVKFLGRQSAHGREYPPKATQPSLKLFEGRPSYANHPTKPNEARDVRTLLGWTANPEERPDGVYGEWHYLKSEPLAVKVAEAAQRNPSVLGFSQVADVQVQKTGPRQIVESIDYVASVDLVAEGATTKGIFEGMPQGEPMKKTFKQFLNGLFGSDARKLRVLEADAPADVMATEMPVDASAPVESAGTSEDQAKAAFKSMVMAVWDDASLSWPDTLKKIKEIAATQEKLLESGTTETPTVETPATPAPDTATPAPDTATEGRIRMLERRLQIRELCDTEGVRPGTVLTKALEGAGSESEMKALIADWKQTAGGAAKPAVKPVSAGRVAESKTPGVNVDTITDGKSLAAACFN
jgi:hypothetical protein